MAQPRPLTLDPGTRLGPYEIVALIGTGGMGAVYKARDSRLDRTVAIKTSKEQFGERFRREAQAIASLNHPHICTLYDVGPDYLVMEYIDGAPLDGPRPVEETLRLAAQIAEALEHAHRHGVVHRDLKPANILVNKSGVKVLDFGLAKLTREPQAGGSDETHHLTLTEQGVVIGTPRYMAPEQVEGKQADARTDVFAFGLVLYEVLAGKPAFEGQSQTALMAAILAKEPEPVTSLQPLVPPALAHLIRTCLAKDPDERRQTMHDVLLELRWIAEGGSQAGIARPVIERRRNRERLGWALAAVMTLAAVPLAFVHFREKPPEARMVRFLAPPPEKDTFVWWDVPALSPDGGKIAFVSAAGGRGQLWVRSLDSLESKPLPGTDGANSPFWSPDSGSVAFFNGSRLLKVDVNGGSPMPLCAASGTVSGAWNRDGVILFRPKTGPLHRVSAAGGDATPVLELDRSRQEVDQRSPQFLPDGRRFIYLSIGPIPGHTGIYLGTLDSKQVRRVAASESAAIFVPPGFLLFGRQDTVVAQLVDPETLEARGEVFPIARPVGQNAGQRRYYFTASENGVLAHVGGLIGDSQLVSYDRNGMRRVVMAEPRRLTQIQLSPDEKRVLAQIPDPKTVSHDLWLLELASGILSRMTSDPANDTDGVWSPDGSEILFSSNRKGTHDLYRMVIGGGDERLVYASDESKYAERWLKDGTVTFVNQDGKSFLRLRLEDGSKPEMLLRTDYFKDEPRVSPDERWVAYSTDESGRWEVYVATFPGYRERRQVSAGGGVQAHWRQDGGELFYIGLEGGLYTMDVKRGPRIETGVPRLLFQTRLRPDHRFDQYAVAGQGQRFLVMEPVEGESRPITVTLNWTAGLRK